MTDAEAKKSQSEEDLPSLRSKLEELRNKKEEWFKKKEDLKLDIANLIKQIKGLKNRSDSSSKSVSELKAERDKCNAQVQELIKKVRQLNKEKKEKLAKSKLTVDPSAIKPQIQRLELKIETEAPSFEQEKRIMKQIKFLKKQREEAKDVMGVFENLEKISRQIDEAKAQAEGFHRQLKDRLAENKKGYSEFMELSKKINELKVIQENAFGNFTKYKREFSEVNRLLRDKAAVKEAERKVKAKKKVEEKKMREEIDKRKLKEKVEEVEEKLKKKKVLTTEDLIAFQGTDQ